MRRIAVVAIVAVMIALVAVVSLRGASRSASAETARNQAPISDAGSVEDDPGGRPVPAWVWQDPFSPDATEVASIEAAGLAFGVDSPDGLGQPIKIVASDEGRYSVVAWVYEDQGSGPFLLDEQIQYFTQDEFEKSMAAPVVVLRNGTRAVVVKTDQIIAVEWLEPLEDVEPGLLDGAPAHAVLEVELVAPAGGEMTVDQLLELANKV